MPYFFEFDPAIRVIRCRFEKRISDSEMREFYAEAPKYVARISPFAGIVDLSAVTDFDVFPETMRALARSSPIMPDPTIPVFVVASSPLTFGMARIFQLVGEETRPNLRVVKTLDEVFVALEVATAKFEPMAQQ